jgi:hypothetical protein
MRQWRGWWGSLPLVAHDACCGRPDFIPLRHPYDAGMIDKSNGYEEHADTFMRKQQIEEIKSALRELGLDDNLTD